MKRILNWINNQCKCESSDPSEETACLDADTRCSDHIFRRFSGLTKLEYNNNNNRNNKRIGGYEYGIHEMLITTKESSKLAHWAHSTATGVSGEPERERRPVLSAVERLASSLEPNPRGELYFPTEKEPKQGRQMRARIWCSNIESIPSDYRQDYNYQIKASVC